MKVDSGTRGIEPEAFEIIHEQPLDDEPIEEEEDEGFYGEEVEDEVPEEEDKSQGSPVSTG